jgi:hypothetical protein
MYWSEVVAAARARLHRSVRPRVSMHIADGILTIANAGNCPVDITDIAIVPVNRRADERCFPAGA